MPVSNNGGSIALVAAGASLAIAHHGQFVANAIGNPHFSLPRIDALPRRDCISP